MTSPILTPKEPSLRGITSFEPSTVKSVQRFDLGARSSTGETGQSNSHNTSISPIWGEARTVPICMRYNHVYYVSKRKFSGVTILQGVKCPIFLLIFALALHQCSATVCLCRCSVSTAERLNRRISYFRPQN